MQLKSIINRYACVLSLLVLLITAVQTASAGEVQRPLTFGGPRFVIDEFEAYVHSDGKILLVNGKVDNVSRQSIRGYITIYLKDSSHDVLNAIDVKLKNSNKIAKGKSGFFEAKINIEGYTQLANVSIDFIEEK